MSKSVQNLKFVLKRQLSTSQKFTDEEFSPKPQSILGPAYSKFYLRRASDLFRQVTIVPEEIRPNDIEEGLLKDAHFLSAVSTLVEEPSLIQRLFLTEESNHVGLYAVWLNDNGTWKPVIVDEYIPCNQRTGSYFPIFAQSTNDELWISLLEKAYAKIYGSYSNIEGGSIQHALRDLTGAPVKELRDEGDVEKIWKSISNAVEKEYFIMCSTDSPQQSQTQDNKKIVEGPNNTYGFTILDTREVETQNGPERLLLIRNTWKNFEWKGEWSNHSEVWTEELRDELKYSQEDANNGLFWIKLEDYEAYFPVTWICKYRPENKYYSVDLHHDARINQNHTVLRIHVQKEQKVTISLNQRDVNCFRGTNYENNYNYSYARLLLGRSFNEGLGYVAGNASQSHRNLTITTVLKPGRYVLANEINWNQDFCRDFNISFYTDGELEVEAIPNADLLTIQKSLILSSIEKVQESRKVRTYAKYGDALIEKTEGSLHGLLYFYYLNDTKKNSKLTEKISFANLEHMRVCAPYHSQNQIEVTVMPDHEVLVLYKALSEDHAWSYSTAFNIQPCNANEDPRSSVQENYDYLDDYDNKGAVEVNKDYNLYIKDGHDLDFEDDQEISRNLERSNYVEERKTSESVKRATYGGRSSVKSEKPAKRYPVLNMEVGQTNSKKIPYINYDGYDKELTIVSSDPKIVVIKEDRFKVRSGANADIRLRFVAPKRSGTYDVEVEIWSGGDKLEETLHFTIHNVDDTFHH